MEKKKITYALEEDWYNRLKQIAKKEYRSLTKQTMIAVKVYIAQYEQQKRRKP